MQAKKTLKQLDDMGHQPLPSFNQFTNLFAKVSCTCSCSKFFSSQTIASRF